MAKNDWTRFINNKHTTSWRNRKTDEVVSIQIDMIGNWDFLVFKGLHKKDWRKVKLKSQANKLANAYMRKH